jgi:membrane protease YdiL (CAAX protease family)
MDKVIGICGVIFVLLVLSFAFWLFNRRSFDGRWLAFALALVLLNDALLTRMYGLLPDFFPESDWNWQGKTLALFASLAIASLPFVGWRSTGLTFRHAKGTLRSCVPVMLVYLGFFLCLALVFPNETADIETIVFQLTMPGLEEEVFYRGILLFALDRAFTSRMRFLGVDWGFGALLSCCAFGLAHAMSFSDGQFGFDAITMALTALPAFIGVWLRYRTGSLLLPIVLHNLGNSISLVL